MRPPQGNNGKGETSEDEMDGNSESGKLKTFAELMAMYDTNREMIADKYCVDRYRVDELARAIEKIIEDSDGPTAMHLVKDLYDEYFDPPIFFQAVPRAKPASER